MNIDSILSEASRIYELPMTKLAIGSVSYIGGCVIGYKATTIVGVIAGGAAIIYGAVQLGEATGLFVADTIRAAANKEQPNFTVVDGEAQRVA